MPDFGWRRIGLKQSTATEYMVLETVKSKADERHCAVQKDNAEVDGSNFNREEPIVFEFQRPCK